MMCEINLSIFAFKLLSSFKITSIVSIYCLGPRALGPVVTRARQPDNGSTISHPKIGAGSPSGRVWLDEMNRGENYRHYGRIRDGWKQIFHRSLWWQHWRLCVAAKCGLISLPHCAVRSGRQETIASSSRAPQLPHRRRTGWLSKLRPYSKASLL